MRWLCAFESMDDDAADRLDRPATAATELEDCDLAAAVDRADPPVWVWRDPDGSAHLGTGEAVRIVAEGATRFGTIEDGLEALTDRLAADPTGPRAFVGARFFHETPAAGSDWDPYPSAVATVPSVQLDWRPDGTTTLTVVEVDGPTDLDAVLDRERSRFAGATRSNSALPQASDRTYHPKPAAWRRAVDRTTDRLATPPLEKAVLAAECRLELDAPVTDGAAIAALIDRHPDCWTFLHRPSADTAFIGATPERLATVEDGRLRTVALAGTIGRGSTDAEDTALREYLIEREGTRHEQASVVGDIVSRLGTASAAIRVGGRRVRTLTDVQHIETPIEATLRDGVGLLDVAGRLHPTPAVAGRPRASALALIGDTEVIDRGWYAAPIGVVDPAGDGTLAVAIRSARIDGQQATLYAGNGIVASSDPEEEWQELLLKFQAMAEIFDG